jgi:hypothetical protein
MLDLEKRTSEQEKTAENAAKDSRLLAELLDGLLDKKCAVRYRNFKAVYLISEEHPEVLYQEWDVFERMLKSDNNTFKFYAIHILANLAKVDKEGRFERIFKQFYDTLNGNALIPACHVAYVSSKVANAKPDFVDEITKRLLHIDKATYKHKELVQANAVKSFSEYFGKIKDKEGVLRLVKELHNSKSSRAKKEANEFLKKWKQTNVPTHSSTQQNTRETR